MPISVLPLIDKLTSALTCNTFLTVPLQKLSVAIYSSKSFMWRTNDSKNICLFVSYGVCSVYRRAARHCSVHYVLRNLFFFCCCAYLFLQRKKKNQSMSPKALTGRQLTRSDSDIRKGLASLLLEGVINYMYIYIYEKCPGVSNLLNSTSQTWSYVKTRSRAVV